MAYFQEPTPLAADLYIDLGTANTVVMTKNRGLIADEPSVVAYKDWGDGRRTVVAVGEEAKVKIGKTPGNLVTTLPLKEGVIADLDITEAMLRYFMGKAKKKFQFLRPRVVISLPYGVSDVDKQAVREAGKAAGAREVILIEEPMAAAIGAGLPVDQPKGNMVIDIGGGTTDIAIISLYGIVHCESVRVGGHLFDQAIIDYVRRRRNLIIGEQSAEQLKIKIGSALPGDEHTLATVRGVDYVTGLPREISLTSAQIHEAIRGLLDQIIEAARRTLEIAPPDLVPDIIRDGVSLAGGGALLRDLDERMRRDLKIPVHVAEEPLQAIARGGREAIKNGLLLERIALL